MLDFAFGSGYVVFLANTLVFV